MAEQTRRKREETEEERLNRERLDSVLDWIWELDAECVCTYSNRAAEDIVGYTRQEIVGKAVSDLAIPEDFEEIIEALAEAGEKKRPRRNMVSRVRAKDGTIKTLQTNLIPLLDAEDRVTGFRGVSRDITEQVALQTAAQEDLQRSEERCHALVDVLDSSPVGIFILDADFEVVWVNQALESYFGLRGEQIIGLDKRRLIREQIKGIFEDPERFAGKVLATYDNNTYVEDFECHVLAGDGREERWLQHSSQPITSGLYAGGRIEQYTDVTHRKRAEADLEEAEAKYRGLVEQSLVGVYLIQGNRFVYVNPRFAEIFGYTQDEIVSEKAPLDLVVPEQRERAAENLRKRLAGKIDAVRQFSRGLRKDGSVFDIEALGSRATYQGKPAVIGSMLDVTERVQAERSRRKLERQTEAHKRQFYRETILSVSDGKLDICTAADIRPYVSSAQEKFTVEDAAGVASARWKVERFCREIGLAEDRLDLFVVGVGEAITNAIKHGGRADVYAGAGEGCVWVAVADKGKGIESLMLPRVTLLRGFSTRPSLGLGYTIMLDVADHILLKTGVRGTTVILVKNLREPEMGEPTEQLPDTWECVPG